VVGAAIHFFFPLSQRGKKGDFFICHYPEAKPGECMGMLGEYSAGKGMRNSLIAIVKKKMRPHCF
jgi:hypothetical protein